MKAIITGMNGTVAPYAARTLEKHGFEVRAWDRAVHPTEDEAGGRAFLDAARPDWLMHIGMGPAEWAESLAAACRERGIRFLYTSTVSVYADREQGPILPETPADSTSEYAIYKLDSEKRIRIANPDAIIARIAWQIGSEPDTNNMFAQLLAAAAENGGRIEASTRWYPAASFLEDTADSLYALRSQNRAGTYLLDANRRWNYYQIAEALNRLHDAGWDVVPTDDFALDLRMTDRRVRMRLLETRLPLEAIDA